MRSYRGCMLLASAILVVTVLLGCGGDGEPEAAQVPAPGSASSASQVTLAADTSTSTKPPGATETLAVAPTTPATETPAETQEPSDTEASGGAIMRLTSAAFEDGDLIPPLYTCDGQDISPPLTWQDPPQGTLSFALICDDPDAPGRTWVHWVMYNIPPDVRYLDAGVPSDAALPDGTQQGQNSWPRTGYGGPCPPSGTHRYVFSLYALDTTLDAGPNDTNKAALVEAMYGHVLAETTLTGLYGR